MLVLPKENWKAGEVHVAIVLKSDLARVEREVKERGFSGLRLRPCADRSSTWMSDPKTFPLWEKAAHK